MTQDRELRRAFLKIVWAEGAADPEWLERMDEINGYIEEEERIEKRGNL